MLNGTYAYRFLCGPTPSKVNVTIHAFHENGLASVAEISWTGSRRDWSLFREFHRSRLFGFNPEKKTWKLRGTEALYYTITEGNPEKDGFSLLG